MNAKAWNYILGAVLILSLNSCASGQKSGGGVFGGGLFSSSPFVGGSPLFEDPPGKTLFTNKEIFKQALELHKKGQTQPAIQLWKDFLQQQPKSFEALNNLGMAHYSSDHLDKAVQLFKTALELKPSDKKITGNLIRALRFRSTLAKENKEHPRAVADLQEMAVLVAPSDKEKILKEIEQEQDIIYKQVEQTNSLAAYQSFASEYPDSIFAEKAKLRMAEIDPQAAGPKEFESGPGPWPPPEPPVKLKNVPAVIPPPQVEGNLTTEEKVTDEIKDFSVSDEAANLTGERAPEDSSLEPAREIEIVADETEKVAAIPPAPDPAPAKTEKPEPGREKFASVPPRTTSAEPARKIKITTKSSPLNVRKSPSTKSPVIGKVGKGTVHSVLEEKDGWFHIVYSKGKTTGWISKKYSQVVE